MLPVVGEYRKATCYAQVVLAHRNPLNRSFCSVATRTPSTTVIIRLVRNCALERMIQYAVTVIITLEGRGVPDAPPWA